MRRCYNRAKQTPAIFPQGVSMTLTSFASHLTCHVTAFQVKDSTESSKWPNHVTLVTQPKIKQHQMLIHFDERL